MYSEQEKIISLIEKIQLLHPTVSLMSKCFRENLDVQYISTIDKESAEYWRLNTYGNALVKLRILLEDNFNGIETLGLVATTRYVFELTVWLNLFESDVNYALVYQQRLFDGQKRYYEDTLNQYKREAEMLKEFENEDTQNILEARKRITSHPDITQEESSAIIREAQNKTDATAARLFSIYTDEAKINGYSYQAFLLESKSIPDIQEKLISIQTDLDEFDKKNSSLVKGLLKCSNWSKMAEKANMLHEYEYIYSITSKLLHCTPASMTTNQKKLEHAEVIIFLRYILTKIQDIIDLTKIQPEYEMYQA